MTASVLLVHPALRRLAYGAVTAGVLTLAIVQAGQHDLWLAFAIGLVAPDLALAFGGGSGLSPGQLHPRAVGLYNAVHRVWGPLAVLAACGAGVLGGGWLVLALAWATHVALDRTIGYGLRDAAGFQRGG
ncbi:MAG: hypothetical protein QOG15_2039 [Solirubrobacteraceae bacterium]|nr:hypothetical protein [Solirubrobacteraceae bacterium]